MMKIPFRQRHRKTPFIPEKENPAKAFVSPDEALPGHPGVYPPLLPAGWIAHCMPHPDNSPVPVAKSLSVQKARQLAAPGKCFFAEVMAPGIKRV